MEVSSAGSSGHYSPGLAIAASSMIHHCVQANALIERMGCSSKLPYDRLSSNIAHSLTTGRVGDYTLRWFAAAECAMAFLDPGAFLRTYSCTLVGFRRKRVIRRRLNSRLLRINGVALTPTAQQTRETCQLERYATEMLRMFEQPKLVFINRVFVSAQIDEESLSC